MVKQDFGAKIDTQCHDLEAMFATREMEVRGWDAEFLKLWTDISQGGKTQNADWKRRALCHLFKFDMGMFLHILNDCDSMC